MVCCYVFTLPRIMGVLLCVLCCALPMPLQADWTPLIDRLIADRFDEREIRVMFERPDMRYDPEVMSRKVRELVAARCKKCVEGGMRMQRKIYGRFLQPGAIAEARAYAERRRDVLKRIASKYCVPEEIVVAIVLVETDLGRVLGRREAFTSLASMALSSDLDMIRPYLSPGLVTRENEEYVKRRCKEKAEWAYRELKSLLMYASKSGIDPLVIPGSIYGAIGICQFMPSQISVYGVDADMDGYIDVFSEMDAFYSIANYLRAHGWKCGISKKGQYRVIMAYNPSHAYASTVVKVAERIKKGTSYVSSR